MSEFDYLGKEDSDLAREENDDDGDENRDDGTRKSLEKDFEDAAEEDATQAESPVALPKIQVEPAEDEFDTEVPDFKINPVSTYQRRPKNSYQQPPYRTAPPRQP